MDDNLKAQLLTAQKNEMTEHIVYGNLARRVKDAKNRDVLSKISADELAHHNFWKTKTGADVAPSGVKVFAYTLVARLFGLTFGIKLMEKGEQGAQEAYNNIAQALPEAEKIRKDEEEHETKLLAMIDETFLKYVSSMVLGLNDALVEFMGALAGFTLALQRPRLIAMTGLITGVAAALSMAASEYLSQKSEEAEAGKSPLRAAVYTGIAYIATVFLLVSPFLIFGNPFVALFFTVVAAIAVIFGFTFYISVAKDLPFFRRFLEMAGLSLSVAAVSFFIGYLARLLLGVDG